MKQCIIHEARDVRIQNRAGKWFVHHVCDKCDYHMCPPNCEIAAERRTA